MADETRLNILRLLMNGEACVCEIGAAVKKSQPTISQHLRILKEAGLIDPRREGLNIYYRLKDEKVALIIDVLGIDAIKFKRIKCQK